MAPSIIPETGARRLSYADYVALPDDGRRHEILDGRHAVTPAPSVGHQRVLTRLLHRLLVYLEAHPVGEVLPAPCDVRLSVHDVVQPDLVFVSRGRAAIVGERSLRGAPDLVVEVASASTRERDRHTKREIYERHGVSEYWLVDPAALAVAVYRRGEGGFGLPEEVEDVLTSPLLPGFTVEVDDLFPPRSRG